MSDRLRAWLRTVIPTAWSALIAWLVTLGAPTWLTDTLGDAGHTLVVPLVLGAVYAALRALEAHLPDWLTRILLGAPGRPTYPAPLAAQPAATAPRQNSPSTT